MTDKLSRAQHWPEFALWHVRLLVLEYDDVRACLRKVAARRPSPFPPLDVAPGDPAISEWGRAHNAYERDLIQLAVRSGALFAPRQLDELFARYERNGDLAWVFIPSSEGALEDEPRPMTRFRAMERETVEAAAASIAVRIARPDLTVEQADERALHLYTPGAGKATSIRQQRARAVNRHLPSKHRPYLASMPKRRERS